jgi:hypothetical protein
MMMRMTAVDHVTLSGGRRLDMTAAAPKLTIPLDDTRGALERRDD